MGMGGVGSGIFGFFSCFFFVCLFVCLFFFFFFFFFLFGFFFFFFFFLYFFQGRFYSFSLFITFSGKCDKRIKDQVTVTSKIKTIIGIKRWTGFEAQNQVTKSCILTVSYTNHKHYRKNKDITLIVINNANKNLKPSIIEGFNSNLSPHWCKSTVL